MRHLLCSLALLTATWSALAQDAKTSPTRAMYEDIEVMRNLVARQVHARQTMACAACHVDINVMRSTGDSLWLDARASPGDLAMDLSHTFLRAHPNSSPMEGVAVEGAYVKGQGVIFQVTMPIVPPTELAFTQAGSAAKAGDDWAAMRRQMLGEKLATTRSSKHPTLADLLLRSLAENGKNFRALAEGENLTIVVVFRENAGGPGPGHRPWKVITNPTGATGGGMSLAPPSGAAGGGGVPAPNVPGDAGAGGLKSEQVTSDRALELLGDLHMKRNDRKEAASAYERALAKAKEAKLPRERVVSIAKKLLDAQMHLNDFDGVRKTLDAIAGGSSAEKPVTPPATPVIRTPGRLILSAPQKLLAQVGEGKMSLAEFQKQISLEIIAAGEQPSK